MPTPANSHYGGLSSGDVVVMSKSSRKAYHAVPRVLSSAENETWFDQHDQGGYMSVI
jgi:hypothetical protein